MFVDLHSPAGRVFRAWLEEQIEQRRRSLEKPLQGLSETQVLRGQIKALRLIVEVLDTPGMPESPAAVETILIAARSQENAGETE